MHWVSILFIGIASNLDNLGIGVSFGIRTTKIPIVSNLIIAVISMISTLLSMSAGSLVDLYIPHRFANFFGGSIIICIGIWTAGSIFHQYRSHEKIHSGTTDHGHTLTEVIRQPAKADVDHNHIISWKESLTLGLALALNCIASGFGAGVSGISPLWMTLFVGVLSFVTVDLGLRLGLKISTTWIGKYSNVFAGFLLILIGLYELHIT